MLGAIGVSGFPFGSGMPAPPPDGFVFGGFTTGFGTGVPAPPPGGYDFGGLPSDTAAGNLAASQTEHDTGDDKVDDAPEFDPDTALPVSSFLDLAEGMSVWIETDGQWVLASVIRSTRNSVTLCLNESRATIKIDSKDSKERLRMIAPK